MTTIELLPNEAMSSARRAVPIILFAGYVILFIWGAINPYDRATWWAENIPIVILVSSLAIFYLRGVRFSSLAYILMAVLPYWHTVGGHYTFERVPFSWFDRAFGFQRNTLGAITTVLLFLILRSRRTAVLAT